jgi:hypothetical protein
MDSILGTIKKSLGIEDAFDGFDNDIILGINTALMSLNQIGIGPTEGYSITDSTQTWTDFLGDSTNVEAVKSHIGLKVRLLFDPPTNSFLIEAIKNQITEIEWRLAVQTSPTN